MTDPVVIKDSRGRDIVDLDVVLAAVYCINLQCPSIGRKRPGLGRYLGKNTVGQPAEFYCPDCGRVTRVRPMEQR